jgi:hypothetical protein
LLLAPRRLPRRRRPSTASAKRFRRRADPTDDFAIEGMAATARPGLETFVNGLNPAGGGTFLISAESGFSNCGTAP